MIRLSVIGSGYVGTTIAACFAELGHEVVNVDIDQDIVDTINDGTAPIHEDGLAELVARHAGVDGTGRLGAITDYGAVFDTTSPSSVYRRLRTPTGASISPSWRRVPTSWESLSPRKTRGTR